jgi:N-formylglutamate deformylase
MPNTRAFQFFAPLRSAVPLPVIVDLPHCGGVYPEDFQPAVPIESLFEYEEAHLDIAFSGAPRLGATVLLANVGRTYVDLNEDASEINPLMFLQPKGLEVALENHEITHGVFPSKLPNGERIYARKMTFFEAQTRLEKFYFPYRSELQRLVSSVAGSFPVIAHLSCHLTKQLSRADVTVPKHCYETADSELIGLLGASVRNSGLTFEMSDEIKIGSIVRDTGDPLLGIHSVELYFHDRLHRLADSKRLSEGFREFQNLADMLVTTAADFARACHLNEEIF